MYSGTIADDAVIAADRIGDYVRKTPLEYSPYFSEITGANVWLILLAVAEKRKNGRMNMPAAAVIIICAFIPAAVASRQAMSTTMAFLNILSLKAPRNWVRNSGRKRRV